MTAAADHRLAYEGRNAAALIVGIVDKRLDLLGIELTYLLLRIVLAGVLSSITARQRRLRGLETVIIVNWLSCCRLD